MVVIHILSYVIIGYIVKLFYYFLHSFLIEYPSTYNITYFWNFGFLVIQIIVLYIIYNNCIRYHIYIICLMRRLFVVFCKYGINCKKCIYTFFSHLIACITTQICGFLLIIKYYFDSSSSVIKNFFNKNTNKVVRIFKQQLDRSIIGLIIRIVGISLIVILAILILLLNPMQILEIYCMDAGDIPVPDNSFYAVVNSIWNFMSYSSNILLQLPIVQHTLQSTASILSTCYTIVKPYMCTVSRYTIRIVIEYLIQSLDLSHVPVTQAFEGTWLDLNSTNYCRPLPAIKSATTSSQPVLAAPAIEQPVIESVVQSTQRVIGQPTRRAIEQSIRLQAAQFTRRVMEQPAIESAVQFKQKIHNEMMDIFQPSWFAALQLKAIEVQPHVPVAVSSVYSSAAADRLAIDRYLHNTDILAIEGYVSKKAMFPALYPPCSTEPATELVPHYNLCTDELVYLFDSERAALDARIVKRVLEHKLVPSIPPYLQPRIAAQIASQVPIVVPSVQVPVVVPSSTTLDADRVAIDRYLSKQAIVVKVEPCSAEFKTNIMAKNKYLFEQAIVQPQVPVVGPSFSKMLTNMLAVDKELSRQAIDKYLSKQALVPSQVPVVESAFSNSIADMLAVDKELSRQVIDQYFTKQALVSPQVPVVESAQVPAVESAQVPAVESAQVPVVEAADFQAVSMNSLKMVPNAYIQQEKILSFPQEHALSFDSALEIGYRKLSDVPDTKLLVKLFNILEKKYMKDITEGMRLSNVQFTDSIETAYLNLQLDTDLLAKRLDLVDSYVTKNLQIDKELETIVKEISEEESSELILRETFNEFVSNISTSSSENNAIIATSQSIDSLD